MSVGAVSERKERPAYVRFERVAKENKAKSLEAGHYVADDVDYALITPPYSKDEVRVKAKQWFENMEADVRNNRMPVEWQEGYIKQYRAWQNGQEIPLNGTPILGWGLISPAMQKTLIEMRVMTVEDLAAANDEGLRRMGMGALEHKNKAITWLATLKDKGSVALEAAQLRSENAILADRVRVMEAQIAQLVAVHSQPQSMPEPVTESISADDILPEPEPKTITLKKK